MLKYIKLYENFFKDMELAADKAHEPVPLKKKEPKPEKTMPKVEEPEPVETSTEVEADQTSADSTPSEAADFKSWLSGKVKRVVECDETPDSTKCWVELENGTSIQWSISMEDYPTVEASFKLGEDTVYMDDVTSGRIAREYYTKKREYDPKAWAECVLKIGAGFPDFMRRMEKEAINRATDQDIELSKLISAEFGTQEKMDESMIELMKLGIIQPDDLDLVTLRTEHQSNGSNPHYGLSPDQWFKLKQTAADLGIFHSSGYATGEVYGTSWTGPSNSFTEFTKRLRSLPNPPIREWFSSHKSKNDGELYRNEVEKYTTR